MSQKRIIVIAASGGSDGDGLEADQKVIAAHGCDTTTAMTALPSQISRGGVFQVKDYGTYYDSDCDLTPEFVEKAIDGCFVGGGVDVVKIGYLSSGRIVWRVVDALREYGPKLIVVDQVPPENEDDIFKGHLLPLTTVLTLTIGEALFLFASIGTPKLSVRKFDDLISCAKALHDLGPQYVLLKGDQLPLNGDYEVPVLNNDKQVVVDVLYDGTEVSLIKTAYVVAAPKEAKYALASAIASNLALGDAVPSAIQKAYRYVEAGISQGNGPFNYFHSTYTLPFSTGYFIEYILKREDVKPVWHAHVHHDFVKRIGDGTLPIEKFKEYLIQDYLFLVQFARAKALSAYKTNSMEDIAASAEEILYIQREMSLHLNYCAEFGLSKKEVEEQEEHQACTAYTRYVLDIAHSESWFALQMAFAPCLLGYGIIARRLWDDPETVRDQGNRYWKWIENYVADDYSAAVKAGEAILEKHAVLQSPSQIESLVKIFVHATKMETGFWDMGNE